MGKLLMPEAPVEPAAPMSKPPRSSVLVVDDNAAGRYVTVHVLRSGDHTVAEAATGAEALEKAASLQPDLIVLDVNLPDISGFEVARTLRQNPALGAVPILMVSAARVADTDRVLGLEGGADAYLTHPIDPAVLLATTRALLRVRFAEAELRQLNTQLEEKVARRTVELQERSAALEAQSAELARQGARLAEVNSDLEAFAYSISHDLRSPVRHIMGFADLLERRLGEGLDPQVQRYLDNIGRSAETMNTLIDALLAFSRFGLQEINLGPVNLQALFEDVRAEQTQDVQQRQVEWEVSSLPVVQGDRQLLRLVLTNLLGNALKYTRTRDVARITVRADETPEAWTISVQDNGVGFDPRYQNKLFGVFQRLHYQHEFEGTGVGLATVRRIITRHGGNVTAASAVNEGAKFTFTLPKSS